MRSTLRILLVTTIAALVSTSSTSWAGCQKLGFTVNDYGKDGPTKDAKELLDKHIAKTMADRGVVKFTTGKKSVKCELFLDFIVFDEHTCTAEATVCWDGAPLPKGEAVVAEPAGSAAPAPSATSKSVKPAAASKSAAKSADAKPADAQTTDTEAADTSASATTGSSDSDPAVKAEKPAVQ